ncbi:MAG: 50S ribosomal protein L24 [Ruminococcus sp.]
MNNVHVKTGDTVVVISGKDKGKKGKVLAVSPKEGKIIVEKVNMVSKHVKPRKMGEQGGIIKAEGAFYACKAQVYCSHCKKATRVAHKVSDNGVKTRVCAKCGEKL